MKPMLGVLAMAIMVTITSAQSKTPVPAAGKGVDTMQQATTMQDREHTCGMHTDEVSGFCKNRGTMFGNLGMHERFGDRMGPQCGMGPSPCMRMYCCAGRHEHRFLFFGLLVMGILNVLLTIIVAVDMSRIGKFNGIWIAVTLLCGVPGTAIYALFRIGDAIERAKMK